MKPRVTVVGSFAVGLTLRADRFPVRGETLIGRDYDQGPGGKGSNQAVQAARLGADVQFVGVIGTDQLGDMAVKLYANEGVGTDFLTRTANKNTGVGFIVLDVAGDNFIILDPGANSLLTPALIDRATARIQQSGALITQLEIPTATAVHALRIARQSGVPAILNPAPARRLESAELAAADLITPNETELRILLGRAPDDPTPSLELCAELIALGVRAVVLTRGAAGALIVTCEGTVTVPSMSVNVVDTTGAGDAFNGALATALASGADLEASVRQAVVAGALACTQLGAIPALAHRADLDQHLREGEHQPNG